MSDLENKKNPVVITIARDFGAEGHEIGRMLADELGIPLYDNELLVREQKRLVELNNKIVYRKSEKFRRIYKMAELFAKSDMAVTPCQPHRRWYCGWIVSSCCLRHGNLPSP